jgi:hypothetical protein
MNTQSHFALPDIRTFSSFSRKAPAIACFLDNARAPWARNRWRSRAIVQRAGSCQTLPGRVQRLFTTWRHARSSTNLPRAWSRFPSRITEGLSLQFEKIAHNTTCWWLFCTKSHVILFFLASNTIFLCSFRRKHKKSSLAPLTANYKTGPLHQIHYQINWTYRSLEASMYRVHPYVFDKI